MTMQSHANEGVTSQYPVLQIKDLRVDFPTRHGTLHAVSDVSLTIQKGEILGVVGESGAGKSMTGQAVLGLLEPPGFIGNGQIFLHGERIDQYDDKQMQRIRGCKVGAIFQDPLTSLNPLFTVGQQLIETIQLHSDLTKTQARARAIELMNEVGIPAAEERVDHFPHQFSGGMRQRVVISLALAGNPELIIADEPTTALDVSIQAQIMLLLRKLCETHGTAIMLVTHDMGVIAEAADRVAVLYAGRIIEIGCVESVIRHPKHPYTVGLMQSIPALSTKVQRLTQISGTMPGLDSRPKGCAFHPRCTQAKAICKEQTPPLQEHQGASVACWLYTDQEGKQ